MHESLTLGLDGGGTRCRARLRDTDGRLLGEAEGGLANVYQDFEAALRTVVDTASAALACAGLTPETLPRCRAGLGLAGVTGPAAAKAVRDAGLPFAAIAVDNDAAIACIGAHGGKDGGIVISGTGSAALAIRGGERHAVGGWGFALGDDGSGAAIGRAALRRTILAHDGLVPGSSLTDEILRHFGRDVPAMVDWARTALSRDYGRFAPLVFAAGEAGDEHAVAILDEAAASVSALGENLLAFGVARICLVGSVARALAGRLSPVAAASVVEPVADPMDGAILLAGGKVAGLDTLELYP
jgi:glucosamine kinase